jgi:hypothetical protein
MLEMDIAMINKILYFVTGTAVIVVEIQENLSNSTFAPTVTAVIQTI